MEAAASPDGDGGGGGVQDAGGNIWRWGSGGGQYGGSWRQQCSEIHILDLSFNYSVILGNLFTF